MFVSTLSQQCDKKFLRKKIEVSDERTGAYLFYFEQ